MGDTARAEPEAYKSVFMIEVEKIRPNPMQPRKDFNEEALHSLANSIRQYGVLQPLVVTRAEEVLPGGTRVYYELISGERRLRAARVAGLPQVPVVIHDGADEREKLELAIIENLQRDDLHPLERALAFQRLVADFGMKQHEVAARVGKSRPFVANSIRLLALPQEIQDALWKRDLAEGHARALLALGDRPDDMMALFNEIIAHGLRTREVEERAQQIMRPTREEESLRQGRLDRELQAFQNQLSDMLGTRVYINDRRGRGRILIDYFSREELQSLLNRVSRQASPTGGQADRGLVLESEPAAAVVVENTADELDDLVRKFSV